MRKFYLPLVAVVVLFLLIISSSISAVITAHTTPTVAQSPSKDCVFAQFSATIKAGPDAGMSLQGNLHLHISQDGSVTGVLKQAKGSDIGSVGQANGRAINLVFDLGHKHLIYGVGTLQNPIQMCNGSVGGPFVGPAEKDSGSWLAPLMCVGINCLTSQEPHSNPDAVVSPRACCK